MLKDLVRKLQSFTGGNNVFDASQFGDPIAEKTKWVPLKNGGTNFRTHELVLVNPDRMEFKATSLSKLCYLVFAIFGISFIILFLSTIPADGFSINMNSLISPLAGLLFTAIGVFMFYKAATPIVFDKLNGLYWKGRKTLSEVSDYEASTTSARFETIHALQIVSEYCRGSKSNFYSYELNLVLKNGNRINVIDHGSYKKLRKDADTLAEFLGKPVWDAVAAK